MKSSSRSFKSKGLIKMTKIWQVIKYEYTRHVFRKRFLVILLSLPVAVIALVLLSYIIASFAIDTTPVGYIDPAGMVDESLIVDENGSVFDPVISFIPYPDEARALEALESGEIQAYFTLPDDYPESQDVQLTYNEEPDGMVQDQFTGIIQNNLVAAENLSPEVDERLQEGSLITFIALDGSREVRQDQWFLILTPFIAGVMFIIVVMSNGGYLLQAVVEEKENRTMEIVITSVSPGQLMTGKIIGNIAVGLTQLIIWLIFLWIGLSISGNIWPILKDFSLPTNYLLVMLLVMLPAFVMVAALMAAIGSTMTEMREAQQVSGMFSLSITIPFYLSTVIMENPNGTLAMILSFFPLSAPITILMRMAFTVVPTWQLALNIAILVLFAIFSIWFAGKAFRMGMLLYGKKLPLKDVFKRLGEK
jgi:ABC-2 type transport system permease protein